MQEKATRDTLSVEDLFYYLLHLSKLSLSDLGENLQSFHIECDSVRRQGNICYWIFQYTWLKKKKHQDRDKAFIDKEATAPCFRYTRSLTTCKWCNDLICIYV